MLDYIESHQGDEHNALRKMFIHPAVFDGLVSVLIQELTSKAMRPHLCDKHARKQLIHQLVTKVRAGLGDVEIRSFAEICEHIPCLKLELKKADL